MTDFANLAIKIDSTQADDAARDLGQLTRAGSQAEQAVDRLGDTAQQSGQQMRGAGRAAADYAQAAQAAAARTTQVGETGRLARHHMTNLTFQFQDLGLQMAAAAQSGSPLQGMLMALMQQGSQISGIMMQAGVSFGGLAKQVGGAAGAFLAANPAITAFASVIGVAGVSAAFFAEQVNEQRKGELEAYAASLNLSAKEMAELGKITVSTGDVIKGFAQTVYEYIGIDVPQIFSDMWAYVREGANETARETGKEIATIYAAFVGTYNGVKAVWGMLPSVLGEAAVGAANAAIRALNWLLRKGAEYVNQFSGMVNSMLAKIPGLDAFRLGTVTAPQIDQIANPYAGAGKAAWGAFTSGYTDAYNESLAAQGKFWNKVGENAAQSAKDGYRDRAKKAGFLDDDDAKAAGGKVGKTAGQAAAEAFQRELAKMGEKAMEGVLLGNIAREKNRTAELDSELFDLNEQLRRSQEERTRGVLEAAEAQARLNDQLRELVTQLDQLGGFGRTLGDLGAAVYGIRTGDYSGVRGPAGIILQQLGGISWSKTDANGDRTIYRLGEEFSKVLTKVFGENGSFTNLLRNAGVGVATGQVLFGQDNKAAQIGGAIGAVAGSFLPIPGGQFIGSLIGSTIGSMFGKRPRGSGSVSNTGINTSANDAGVGQSLDSFGLGLQSSLSQIAQQLGGSVGAYSIGIGQYKDYFQVSSSANDPRLGGTYFGKKSSSALYDGQDAGAAMRAAIAGAIAQGALQGISAGAQALLKSGKDIEAQLAKALKFQGVFDELKATTDPLGAALDEINKRFTELRTIFAEAGASAEEYAQLEQLLALKRQEAQDDARRAVVDKVRDPIEMQIRLLELLGREEDALAASRLLELAGIKAALQPLQTMIYQLEDARKVIDTFEPLAEDLKKFRNELLGGEGEQSFGYLAAQFRSIAQAAANGDATALANLRGAGSAYLDAARLNAGSDLEYRRALGMVLSGVDKGIFAADAQVDYAQAQIDAINNSADILARMREEMSVLQNQIVENTGFVARLWSRFEGEGMPIRTLDEPLEIVAVGL